MIHLAGDEPHSGKGFGRENLGAYEDLIETLRQTDVLQQVLAAFEKEPVRLLYAICREYESSKEPVPDHHTPGSGYSKDVALRTLLSAGLLQREPGGRLSVYYILEIPG